MKSTPPAAARTALGNDEARVIQDGWQNEAVKESLDLCLACKGCKSDCPTGVDVATYKVGIPVALL